MAIGVYAIGFAARDEKTKQAAYGIIGRLLEYSCVKSLRRKQSSWTVNVAGGPLIALVYITAAASAQNRRPGE